MEATVAAAALEAAQVAAEFMQRRGAQRSWAPTRSSRYLIDIYIQKYIYRSLIDIHVNIYVYL